MTRHFLPVLLLALSCLARSQEPPPPPVTVDAADYDTLQAALDAVPESGGLVRLPPGRFEIHQPLVVETPETRIEGAGASTHVVNRNENGRPALHVRPPTFADDPEARLWRIQLGNFRISGNEKSGDGVLAQGIQEIFVHGLSVDRNGAHGIFLDHCYEDPRVADSILTYNGASGLHLLGCHDIVVNANHFEENRDALTCHDGFNLTCGDNNLDDHLRHGIVIENTYGSVVSGNMIEECQGIAILLDRDCYGITLSANVIAHDLEGGIDLRDAWGCTVSANTFTIVHEFGVRVGPDSGRIAITGNNFGNSHIGDGKRKRKDQHEKKIQRDAGHGVLLEDAEDVAISGNVFGGMDARAVTCEGDCERISVTGNVVTDWGRREQPDTPLDVPEKGDNHAADNVISP